MPDHELIELFEKNGQRRVTATALALFKDGQQRSAAEIERETGLRQPEVCVSMSQMVLRGWFRAEYIKNEGKKGRSYCIYHLAVNYRDICQDIARERGERIAEMMADMNALRTVA